MPRARKSEKVLVVRVDREGNVINYETTERPIKPVAAVKSSSKNRSQSPRVRRIPVHEEENDRQYYTDNNSDQEYISVVNAPRRKTYRDPVEETTPRRRRLRYVAPKSNVKIFEDRLNWNANPKVDTHNEEAIEQIESSPRRRIVDEPVIWHAKPKINSHNDGASDGYRNGRQPINFDDEYIWINNSRTDNYDEEQERSHRRYYSQEQKPLTIKGRIDNQNPEYEDYKKRQRVARFPSIKSRKVPWQPSSRVRQTNDDYVERMRQEQPKASIFRKKPTWNYVRTKIDNHNEEYQEYSRGQPKPRIVNELPYWRSRPKINTFNDSYDPNASSRNPRIFNEKPRWQGRTKLDTGFVLDSNGDEYVDYGSQA